MRTKKLRTTNICFILHPYKTMRMRNVSGTRYKWESMKTTYYWYRISIFHDFFQLNSNVHQYYDCLNHWIWKDLFFNIRQDVTQGVVMFLHDKTHKTRQIMWNKRLRSQSLHCKILINHKWKSQLLIKMMEKNLEQADFCNRKHKNLLPNMKMVKYNFSAYSVEMILSSNNRLRFALFSFFSYLQAHFLRVSHKHHINV